MPWSDDMVPGTPAYVIAASLNPRIRVVAGPGTGKSFAMKRRVARLLEFKPCRSGAHGVPAHSSRRISGP